MLTENGQIADVTDHVTVALTKPAGHPSSADDCDSRDSVTVPPVVANTDGNVQMGRITLPEASRTGVIPLKPDAARTARMRDLEFPKRRGEGQDQAYTLEELQN